LKLEEFSHLFSEGIKVAVFGSRETPTEVQELMEKLSSWMVSQGARLASGHANGADLAWERGACLADPEKFTVCLPWRSYNDDKPINPACCVEVLTELSYRERSNCEKIAAEHHPAWRHLSSGARLLHARNILIGRNASLGFCYLNHEKPGGGGSGQCYRFLTSMKVPVVDLSLPLVVKAWQNYLTSQGH